MSEGVPNGLRAPQMGEELAQTFQCLLFACDKFEVAPSLPRQGSSELVWGCLSDLAFS